MHREGGRGERPAEALELFLEMKKTGVRVDEVPERVHQDVYIGSALVDMMYSKCGFSDNDASEVFAEIPCKNLVSWTALIVGYVSCERFKNALNAFEDILNLHLLLNLPAINFPNGGEDILNLLL
nr:pentatricopeptide repeat-containing protein At1g50270 [Ipomoea batatas]